MRINFSVDGYSRCNCAGADAAESIDGEKSVFGGFAGFDSENFGEFINDLLCAFNVAGGSEASADDVFSVRFEREERIESYYSVNFGNGDAGALGNNFLNLKRNISIFFLDIAEDHNERCFFVYVSVTDLVDLDDSGFAEMSHFRFPP